MLDLKEELKQLMEKKNLSFLNVSRSLGISKSGLNMWMNGNYSGNEQKLNKAVKSFIEREKIKDSRYSLDFTLTSIAKTVFEVAQLCHIESEIGVVYGKAGLGKTTAVKEYAKSNSDVILIEVDFGYTARVLFSELHKKVGYEGRGTVYSMMQDIIFKLKDSGRLIIVDEAEHLPYKVLELLRRIYDKANVGILLVGMPRLIENLRGNKGEYQQLYSRVGIAKKLNNLNIADTKQIVESILPDKNNLVNEYYKYSQGNTRILSKLLVRSVNLATINEMKLDADIIAETSNVLLCR